jgi:predicted PurR-regulated permease PerM
MLVPFGIFAQTTTDSVVIQLQKNIRQLQTELKNQKTDFAKKLSFANDSINSLRLEIERNKANITSISNDLRLQIIDNKMLAENQIKDVGKEVSKNTLYWIIAALAIALFSMLLFIFLRKQLSRDKNEINEHIKKTKKESDEDIVKLDEKLAKILSAHIQQTKKILEEERIKLDSKLVDFFATQIKLLKVEPDTNIPSTPEDANHELVLNIADEIIRIQKKLPNVDAETNGFKQLTASIKRVKDNLAAKGYEIVEMLNKPYNEGDKISANFRTDENLKSDERVITRIIKPQINFKGVTIQAAQVEVSVGKPIAST